VPPAWQRDLVVERDEAFDDQLAGAGASALLRIAVGALRLRAITRHALPLAGRAHDRLDHARVADRLDRLPVLLERGGEAIGRGLEAELLRGQPPDAFTVHRQASGACGGDHVEALRLQLQQSGRRDRLDLGHDEVGALRLDHTPQRGRIRHRDGVRAVRYLHGGRVVVTIDGDHRDAQPLRLDRDLLAELTRSQQEQLGLRGRVRCADADHDVQISN
jgi:hypothetical protein